MPSQGVLRYESATTQAPAVSAHETMVSLHWYASLEPAATMGNHTSSVNMPICNAESVAARREHTPTSTAAPPALEQPPVKYAQATCCGIQLGTNSTVSSR